MNDDLDRARKAYLQATGRPTEEIERIDDEWRAMTDAALETARNEKRPWWKFWKKH